MYSHDWMRVQVIMLVGTVVAVTVKAIQITNLYAKVLIAFIYIPQCNNIVLCDLQSCMQELTFTNWFNDRLRGSKASFSGLAVSDLNVDLKDGTLLIKLLENLTNKKIRGYEKAPNITAHKMVNLDLAFTHMRNEGIKLIGIGKYA